MRNRISPYLINLVIVTTTLVLATSMLFPLRVVRAGAAPEKFSAERALAHLPVIASVPHPSGSPAQALVRDYLVEQMVDLGLEVQVQQAIGADNVVARLKGTDPGKAVLILAHYDSSGGPGAADNGAGTAALVEIMRALASGPAPRNDIIALFDDGEELPGEFTGTKAFVREHPWMEDVRVAVGMDTAARGFITTNDTGQENGWMVKLLARTYTNAAWTSLSGGGNYDTEPFRDAGVQVLELEDNYPFRQQHTMDDVPAVVRPGTIQQLGDQALAVMRELAEADLENTSGKQRTYMFVPYLFLVHYPQSWAFPLAFFAFALLAAAVGLGIWQIFASWKGLGLAAVVSAAISGLGVSAIWKAAPKLLDWPVYEWRDWPETIPPGGWLILILTNLLVLALFVVVYRFVRRWASPAAFSLAGLSFVALFALALGAAEPKAAIVPTWPVIIGSAAWITAAILKAKRQKEPGSIVALISAIPACLYLYTLIPSVFMGDGTKSVAITSAAWAVFLCIILPAVDGLLVRPKGKKGKERGIKVTISP